MSGVLLGIVVVVHGLIHLLYLGQSARLFEMQPGMTWPDGAWLLSRGFGDTATRTLVSVACAITAVGLVVGGIGLIAGLAWAPTLVVAASAISVVLYLLAWDGTLQSLDNQGGIGLLISAALLLVVLVLGWPVMAG